MNTEGAMLTGLVLAGGRSQRMGDADKGLLDLNGRPLFDYPLQALKRIADTVFISANRNITTYAASGCPVIEDSMGGFQGPLAGILSGMSHSRTPNLMLLPCDTPLIDLPMLTRLYGTFQDADAEICVAHDGLRLHPVVMVVRCDLAESLEAFLFRGERKLQRWLDLHRTIAADFSDCADKLVNVNTPEQLPEIEAQLREGHVAPE